MNTENLTYMKDTAQNTLFLRSINFSIINMHGCKQASQH